MANNENWKRKKFEGRKQDNGANGEVDSDAVKAGTDVNEKSIDIPKEPTKKGFYGVLTGIKYSDHDVHKNQLPECVFEAEEGLSEKEISDKAFVERIERKCADCKGCSSYNYYL